jgi:hypothetical protein
VRRRVTIALGAAVVLLGAACATVSWRREPPDGPCVAYRLVYDPRERDPVWQVAIRGCGLAEAMDLALELDDWGEWSELDSYYLRSLESDPPLHRVEGSRTRFRFEIPPRWGGELRVSYNVALAEIDSPAREHHGLLPYRAPTYSLGFSSNTLMSVTVSGLSTPVERRIEIEAPPDWTIATGIAGRSIGRQVATTPAALSNTVISFGRPIATASTADRAAPIEIVQWGGTEDVTASLLSFARTYVAAYRWTSRCG